MPRRFHFGHYVLAGLVAVWLIGGFLYGGRSPDADPADSWESGPQGIGGPEMDRWVMERSQTRTMKVEGWGAADFTWTLWKLARDGNPDVDVWAYEHQGSASPRSRDGQLDPVVSRLYLQATPRTPVEEWMDWSGRPFSDFSMNSDVPGEASLAYEPAWFRSPPGGQDGSYTTIFTTLADEEPDFVPVQEIEFRSFWLGTRSCSSEVPEDGAGDCVTEVTESG